MKRRDLVKSTLGDVAEPGLEPAFRLPDKHINCGFHVFFKWNLTQAETSY